MRSRGADRGLRGVPVRTARTCWRLGIAGRAVWLGRLARLRAAADAVRAAEAGLPGRAAAGSGRRGQGTATAGDGRWLAGVSPRSARTILIETSQNRTAVRSYTCSIANPFYRTPASSVLTHGYDTLRFRRTDV